MRNIELNDCGLGGCVGESYSERRSSHWHKHQLKQPWRLHQLLKKYFRVIFLHFIDYLWKCEFRNGFGTRLREIAPCVPVYSRGVVGKRRKSRRVLSKGKKRSMIENLSLNAGWERTVEILSTLEFSTDRLADWTQMDGCFPECQRKLLHFISENFQCRRSYF